MYANLATAIIGVSLLSFVLFMLKKSKLSNEKKGAGALIIVGIAATMAFLSIP